MQAEEENEWKVLFSEDHEESAPGAYLWKNSGSSGPVGGSFAGVTGVTSSAFSHGWQAYKIRVSGGDHLRERSFWMYRSFEPTAFEALFVRSDFMGDAAMPGTNVVFTLFGGGEGILGDALFHFGVRGGKLILQGSDRRRQILAELDPHRWYRLELNLERTGEGDQLLGTATVREQGAKEPLVLDVMLPIDPEATPLRSIKLGAWQVEDTPVAQRRLYVDNLLLRVRGVE